MQLSSRMVANLLASIIGPAYYDGPHYGHGNFGATVAGPRPEPWSAVMLNPQPLPPREHHAAMVADAHIQEIFTLLRMGAASGGEIGQHASGRAGRLVADLDELCPRWPHWPKVWPPGPPPPPWWRQEKMTATELLMFGTRFLAASETMEAGKLQDAMAGLGEKALRISMQG